MPRPDAPPLTRAVVLRGAGFALAIALGAVAVWLIVTGSMSPRRIEIGVLAGLWGLLLGAYTMFGARRHLGEPSHYVTSGELEVRAGGGLEPAAQAEARRAFEERLEHLLRTEISSSVNREVGDLRREVALLRQELVEKVGGELRLERIETTRLIGSDLEALQHEIRALKTARGAAGLNGGPGLDLGAIPVSAERIDPSPRPSQDAAAAARAIEEQAAVERRRAEAARAEQAAARDRAEREKTEREKTERAAAERAKAEREQAARVTAEQEQAEREAAARAERERRARTEQAAREKAAREKAAREKAAAEQAAREKAAREKAAREKAAAEQAAREKAAAEQAAREKAARAKAAAEKAAREKAAAEQVAREKAAREKAAREKAAAEQAAREKAAAEQAARERAAQQKAAAEQAARQNAGRTNGGSSDPFASLPRITPFTDFELDPVEAPTAQDDGVDEPQYTGRRRVDGTEPPNPGRHSRHAVDEDVDGGGRRRRRDGDDGLDLLSQLLSRGPADR